MSDHEAPDLGDLYRDRLPSPDLEDRVVHELMAVGALRPRPQWGRGRTAAAIAAGIALFLGGWGAGSFAERAGGMGAGGAVQPAGTVGASTSSRFMLLLYEGPDFGAGVDPGSFAAAYGAWAEGVATEGIPIEGDELSYDRTVVGRPGPDGLVGGYFVVEASDAGRAQAIAATHPHVRNGGWIEVVPIVTR